MQFPQGYFPKNGITLHSRKKDPGDPFFDAKNMKENVPGDQIN